MVLLFENRYEGSNLPFFRHSALIPDHDQQFMDPTPKFGSPPLEQLRWNLSEVEDRFAVLVEKEVKIRTLFDLPEINAAERQLGIGGPTSTSLENLSNTEQSALATEL